MSYNNPGDSDNEDEDNDYKQFEIKDGHIFLIEITPALLKPLPGSSDSQLFLILQSINDLMIELIKTMRSTGVGIYFYNCDTSGLSKSSSVLKPVRHSTNGFVKLFKLNFVNLANMKALNDLISDDIKSIRSINHYFKYLENHDTENLPTIFNRLLDEINNKREFNRIKLHWITNNSTPFKQPATKEKLWLIINDIYNFRYFINPIFLKPSAQEEFDVSMYRDIFINTNYLTKTTRNNHEDDSEYDEAGEHGNDDEDGSKLGSLNKQSTILNNQIRQEILRIKEIRRIQFSCDLILSDGPTIGGNLGCSVKGYTLYNKETYKSQIILHNENDSLKKVFLESKTVNESGEVIDLDNPNSEDSSAYKAKSLREKKAEHNIFRGHELAGGDVIYLKPEVEDFMTNYTFDHGMAKKKDKDNNEIEDEFGFGIHDVDEDEDETNGTSKSSVEYTKPPYLKLIGFRDIENLDISYNSKAPIFVTADLNNGLKSTSGGRGGYNNSFKTFSSLYQSCIKLKKYAILFGCIKKNSKPLLFSFYPTRIKYSTRNVPDEEDFPEGFLLLRLPYINDIRVLPDYVKNFGFKEGNDEDEKFISDELVSKYKKLFGSFFYDNYIPNDYPNPSLNYLYKILQAELLQNDLSSEDKKLIKNDITSLKVSEVKQYLVGNPQRVALMDEINNKLREIEDSSHQSESRRRFDEQSGLESMKKRQKVATAKSAAASASSAPVIDEEGILQAWKNDEFNKFTVPQLKQFQQTYRDKIKSATKKQDLIDNIKSFLDSREKS
ncbi:Ku family DNA binding and repair protein [Scheffersomyces coipomensis]|uniref:Ku family DNA binding and repair protein n=1 Tax=Scheffersomyces coipomensis TaxID=1788519 RepID=UPI00315C5E01